MHLYEHPLSSYVQKVKIGLREKGVPFKAEIPADLGSGNLSGPLTAANPRTEVPTLIDGDVRIWDSSVILQYLEDKISSPALLPADPAGRAHARMIEDVCDTQYEAINWGLGEIRFFGRAREGLARTLEVAAAAQTREMMAWLTGQLGGKPWFGGNAFGWADLCVAPFVNRSDYYGLGPQAGSPLQKWLERLRERPSVAATFKEFRAAADAMKDAHKRLEIPGFRRQYRDHRLEWMIKSGGIDVVLEGLKKDNIRFNWPTAQS
jgi:glutathione S-transferase